MKRREFLRLATGTAAGAFLGGCASESSPSPQASDAPSPTSSFEPSAGPVRSFTLEARPATVDIGGVEVPTWTYGGELPGREIRVRRGEIIEARLINRLPTDTSVHWHGVVLPNGMDGVPGITQPPVPAGQEFRYRFAAEVPGTYWFHPHTGLQLERGLYAPLIIEDPAEGSTYDEEWVVVLDDWLDGVDGASPESVWAQLRSGMGRGSMDGMDHGAMGHGGAPMASPSSSPGSSPTAGMLMGARSALLGGDAGDVAYPHYLLNGRNPVGPRTFRGRPGLRVRIRFVNAGGDTAFRVALGGHRLQVTHADGFPVRPVAVDALLIGMGERYDVEVTLADGVFPLVALAEGKDRTAIAFVRTSEASAAPAVEVRPAELDRAVLRYEQLVPAEGHAPPTRAVDREHRLDLRGGMAAYDWTINGTPFSDAPPFEVSRGQRVRLIIENTSMMWHPMHLHGHTFRINTTGPLKDTVAVLPRQRMTCDLDADRPGRWMIHCHNSYHLEAGMMGTVAYVD